MSDEFVCSVPESLAHLGDVDVALVLGSGLSSLADAVESPAVVPFDEIPGFPVAQSAVPGHHGRAVIGMVAGRRVAAFQGRLHGYQGFSARDVAYPVRLASALGAGTLVVTNAAGAIDPELATGDLVLLNDHINLTADSPLTGWSDPQGGAQFVSMRDAYDPELRSLAVQAALETSVEIVPEGVYAGVLGPAFETPAEVAMMRTLGADLVGMSTVWEVIAARALGMRVLGLSLVANAAAAAELSHAEVLEAGRLAAERLRELAIAILQRLP